MASGGGRALRRHTARGTTLLPALGVTTLVLLGTTATLSLVAGESEAQGAARLQRLASFAAEAGLAEGREALAIRTGASTLYNGPLATLPRAADVGSVEDPWFDLLGAAGDPWVAYPMTRGDGPEVAISDDELPADALLAEQRTLRYRVFVRDDGDVDGAGAPPVRDQAFDSNGRVWLVAVGEVGLARGRPVRVVLQQLVRNQTSVSDVTMEPSGQKGGSAAKDFRGSGRADIDIGASATLAPGPAMP